MSTLETHMGGRRVAARNADRNKKLVLGGLLVLLAALLAFQLLKSSDSSSTTAAPPAATTTTATPAVTGSGSVASAPKSAPAKSELAIRRMKSHDPFVPVVRESTPASASSSASQSSASTSGQSASHSTPTSHSAPLTVAPAASALGGPAITQPGLAGPAEPTAAVIWANGKREVVGVAQTFDVGDATFKIVDVGRGAMRLEVADGSFAGGKRTITIHKGRGVTLENDATGVRYTLRFAGGTTEAPMATQPSVPSVPAGSAGSTSSAPSGGGSTSNGS